MLNPSHKLAGNLLPQGAWRVSAITLPGPGERLQPLRPGLLAFRNYEQIVKAHQDNPHEGEDQVSDQVKFNVFQGIMDSLFQSFNACISVASFQELSACVFSWIEEHCKPQVRGVSSHGVRGALLRQSDPSCGLFRDRVAAFRFLEGIFSTCIPVSLFAF